MKAAAGATIVRELMGVRRRGAAVGRLISVVPAGPFGTESLPPMIDVFGAHRGRVVFTWERNRAARAGGVIVRPELDHDAEAGS